MTSSPRPAQALTLALNSHKGLKEALEILYIWLVDLSLGYEFGLNSTNKVGKVVCRGFSLNLENVQSISRILFKELSKRFEVSSDNGSTDQPHGRDGLQSQHVASPEEIVMLLRCCVASINLLDDDQSLLLEGCLVLRKLLFVLYSYGDNEGCEGCATFSHIEPDVRTHLVRRLLEVYVDQLIKHKVLSKYIAMSASPSSVGDSMCRSDFGYVQKAVSVHFLLSVSGAQAFEHFVKNLVWSPKENRSAPEVSLYAAVLLLVCPASASVSSLLRAHIISLVSDAIDTSGHDNMGLSHRLISCYLPAFEKSVSLYHTQLSKLELRSLFSESNDSVVKSSIPVLSHHQGFRACISPVTSKKLDSMIEGLDFSPFLRTAVKNAEMVDVLNDHVKENLHVFDKSCRDVASRFLRFLIRKAYPAESDDATLRKHKNASPEDLCLFASILKLMSSSLLRVVLSVKTRKNPTLHETSRDSLSCKEYEILMDTVNSFGLYRMQLPIQALIHENLEAHCSRASGSKLFFVHLTDLLSVFSACGLQLLAEGCLSVIMVLMNLLYLEEGSLGFLSQLDSSAVERKSPKNHIATPEMMTTVTQEGHMRSRSSVELASKFKKIQMCTIRKGTARGSANGEVIDVEAEDETCNGVIFFECLNKQCPGMTSSVCLDEELVDFVQCKRGKDYGAWLKNRMKYKRRKSERLAVQSREKKRSVWRSGRRRNPGME